ncbi:MAG: SRPBCC family protein [Proteobacteria bacterium]|nr:SRPBCC family protein [Pseudomonadota bacterium]
MNRTIQIAPVRRSIVVEASPQRAFEVFTDQVDAWWPKTHGIGATPIVRSVIEPFVGGRWYTTHTDGKDVTIGHVRAWEPGARFVVSWEIGADWKPDAREAFASEVEVLFKVDGAGKTRIDLEHRNFERMGAEPGEKMRTGVDGGWPGILNLYATYLASGAKS